MVRGTGTGDEVGEVAGREEMTEEGVDTDGEGMEEGEKIPGGMRGTGWDSQSLVQRVSSLMALFTTSAI